MFYLIQIIANKNGWERVPYSTADNIITDIPLYVFSDGGEVGRVFYEAQRYGEDNPIYRINVLETTNPEDPAMSKLVLPVPKRSFLMVTRYSTLKGRHQEKANQRTLLT